MSKNDKPDDEMAQWVRLAKKARLRMASDDDTEEERQFKKRWARIVSLTEGGLEQLADIVRCSNCRYWEDTGCCWGKCRGPAQRLFFAEETASAFGCILWKGK